MRTEKLYETDSHLRAFSARVLSCAREPDGSRYRVMLDRSAFFPKEGGQECDLGQIGTAQVEEVLILGGELIHYTDAPVGGEVDCRLDWPRRFRNMQYHTGEHILSGLIHREFGGENVGFHLGLSEVTCDFSLPLGEEQLEELCRMANRVIAENRSVTAKIYQSLRDLEGIPYRSKLEIQQDIRLVTIEGVDVCACCAPHVSFTGEIGMLSIVRAERIRQTTRLYLRCGAQAIEDFLQKQGQLRQISALLKTPQSAAFEAVSELLGKNRKLSEEIGKLRRQAVLSRLNDLPEKAETLVEWFEQADPADLMAFINEAKSRVTRLCAALTQREDGSSFYVLFCPGEESGFFFREANRVLGGKGGGKNGMAQGAFSASRQEITAYLENGHL